LKSCREKTLKIETLLTIVMTPDNPKEDTKAIYEMFRADIDKQIAAGASISVPPTTQVRWLIKGGLLPDV